MCVCVSVATASTVSTFWSEGVAFAPISGTFLSFSVLFWLKSSFVHDFFQFVDEWNSFYDVVHIDADFPLRTCYWKEKNYLWSRSTPTSYVMIDLKTFLHRAKYLTYFRRKVKFSKNLKKSNKLENCLKKQHKKLK